MNPLIKYDWSVDKFNLPSSYILEKEKQDYLQICMYTELKHSIKTARSTG